MTWRSSDTGLDEAEVRMLKQQVGINIAVRSLSVRKLTVMSQNEWFDIMPMRELPCSSNNDDLIRRVSMLHICQDLSASTSCHCFA